MQRSMLLSVTYKQKKHERSELIAQTFCNRREQYEAISSFVWVLCALGLATVAPKNERAKLIYWYIRETSSDTSRRNEIINNRLSSMWLKTWEMEKFEKLVI